MSYIVWIELERFYAELYKTCEEPLIIDRQKIVLDTNLAGRQMGVAPGMGTRQAKMLLPECTIRTWNREDHVDRQAAWLDICAEFTGIVEPVDQHVAALDLSGHPDPLEVTERLVRALVSRTGLPVRFGAACSKWIAKLAADQGGSERAVEDPRSFLAPLPVSELFPVEEEHRQRLGFLGYGTIGEVARIPLDVLQKQFGQEGLRISAAAQGRHSQPVCALYPKGSMRECLIFEGPVDVWETIDNGLRALAERLGQRLADLRMQGSTVELQVETEDGGCLRMERRFTKQIRNPISALWAFRLLLQDPPEVPVASLRVSLVHLERVRHRQSELNGLDPGCQRHEARSAVNYVRTVFGDGSVKLASEVEVPRRVRVLREWQSATGWR